MTLPQPSTQVSPLPGSPALPKLVLLTHEFKPFRGGVATYCDELAHGIASLGHPIEVWAPDDKQACQNQSENFKIVRLPCVGNLRPGGLFSLARAVWRGRKQLEGAILLLPSVGPQMVVMLLSLVPGWPKIRMATLWHGSEILRFERNFFWKIRARSFFSKAEFLFAASPYVKTLAEKSFLSPLRTPVLVIPCAPGSDALLPPVPVAPDPAGRVRVLTLARLHPRKGQMHTIQALAALPVELKSKVLYQIAGQGDPAYLGKLEQSCAQADIAFEILGAVSPDRLSSVYAQCDIYAMTSRSLARSVEGFGITYLEAGLQSKPVIACRSGGVEGAVIHQETGLLVEEDDLPGLTAAFASLISDEALRYRLGEGNLRYALHFSWNHSAQLMISRFLSSPTA